MTHRQQPALALALAEGLAKVVTLAAQGTWAGVPATTQAALLSRLLAVQCDPAGTPEVVQALAAWSGRYVVCTNADCAYVSTGVRLVARFRPRCSPRAWCPPRAWSRS